MKTLILKRPFGGPEKLQTMSDAQLASIVWKKKGSQISRFCFRARDMGLASWADAIFFIFTRFIEFYTFPVLLCD